MHVAPLALALALARCSIFEALRRTAVVQVRSLLCTNGIFVRVIPLQERAAVGSHFHARTYNHAAKPTGAPAANEQEPTWGCAVKSLKQSEIIKTIRFKFIGFIYFY